MSSENDFNDAQREEKEQDVAVAEEKTAEEIAKLEADIKKAIPIEAMGLARLVHQQNMKKPDHGQPLLYNVAVKVQPNRNEQIEEFMVKFMDPKNYFVSKSHPLFEQLASQKDLMEKNQPHVQLLFVTPLEVVLVTTGNTNEREAWHLATLQTHTDWEKLGFGGDHRYITSYLPPMGESSSLKDVDLYFKASCKWMHRNDPVVSKQEDDDDDDFVFGDDEIGNF